MSTPCPQSSASPAARGPIIRSMMIPAALVALLAIAMPRLMTPAHAETMQQGWVGDLPIMQGMRIEPELGFAFDSPGGRIVLVFAATDTDSQDVLAYYNDALTSLGWSGGDGWRLYCCSGIAGKEEES